MKVESLLKVYLTEAKSQLNEDIVKKTTIIKLVKNLLSKGVDSEKVDRLVKFYKFSLDASEYDLINNSSYKELKSKLEDLEKEI